MEQNKIKCNLDDTKQIELEQYANQKVIEEVNEFKLWLYKNYPDKFIDIDITLLYKLFNKLKQQIWKEHTKQLSGYLKDISKTK